MWFSRAGPNSSGIQPIVAEQMLEGHRVGDLEPVGVDDEAAIEVILRDTRFMAVVGRQDLHSPGQLARPGAAGQHAVLGERYGQLHGPVPERPPAARARLRKRPGPAVDVACPDGVHAGMIEEEREDVARVVPPVREDLRVVHQVAGDELGHVLGLHRVVPVPVVAAPGIVHGPGRQEHVAEIGAPGVAGLDDLAVGSGVSQPDQLVEESRAGRPRRPSAGCLSRARIRGWRSVPRGPRPGSGCAWRPAGRPSAWRLRTSACCR